MNRLLLLLLCFWLTCTVTAQTQLSISTINPNSLFVCGQDTLWFTITNTSAGSLNNTNATLELPSGVEYVSGSVTGATQANITNINSPILGLGDMPAGAVAQVSVLVHAACDLVPAINNGQLFSHTITVTSGAVAESLTSIPYFIETGLLIITSVTPTILTGNIPQTLQRRISIRNTRAGRIGNLRIVDEQNAEGLDVRINSLTDIDTRDTIFDASASGAFIASTGNNDQWLDQNEELVFVEDITITGCRNAAYDIRSLIRVYWGCGSTYCAYDSAVAFVRVEPSTTNPKLEFLGEILPFNDQCHQDYTWQYITIKNTGGGDALNSRMTVIGVTGVINFDATNTQILQNGVWSNYPVALTDADTSFLCASSVPLHLDAIYNLGLVAPNQELQLRFAMYACAYDTCINVQDSVRIEFYYERACPQNSPPATGSKYISPDPEKYRFRFDALHQLNDCILPGQTNTFEFRTIAKRLLTHSGFLKIQMEIPAGLELDTSAGCTPIIKGLQYPPDFLRITPSANGTSRAELAFRTPLPDDTITVGYCLRYNCDTAMVCHNRLPFPQTGGTIPTFLDSLGQPLFCGETCGLEVRAKGAFTIDPTVETRCSFGDCSDYYLAVKDDCTGQVDLPSGVPWPAGMEGGYKVYRTNFGFEDHDNDQIPDSDNIATGPNIDIRRFIPGDTLRVDLRGAVVAPGVSIDRMLFKTFHETLTSDFLVADGDSFRVDLSGRRFCSVENFVYVGGELIIKRANGNTTSCALGVEDTTDRHLLEVLYSNIAPDTIAEYLATMDHTTLADFSDCDGPLKLGDSCIILLDWQIKLNVLPATTDTTFDLRLMNFRTVVDHHEKQYTYLKPNPPYLCQYSGFIYSGNPQSVSIRPCEISQQVTPWEYGIVIARANMFRYEVRPLSQWLEYKYSIPPFSNLLSATLKNLQLQTGKTIASNVNLPFVQGANQVDLDISVLSQRLDEGYLFKTDFVYGPNCKQDTTLGLASISKVWNKPCFAMAPIIDLGFNTPYGYYAAIPKLRLIQNDTLLNILGANANFDLTLQNIRPQVAFNPWVSVQLISGSFSNLQLTNSGAPVQQIGNMFQLPNIPQNGKLDLSVTLTKTSCEPVKLRILYGWNCDPVTNLNGDLCLVDTIELLINSFSPELEMNILNQPDAVNLCDTTDWFEIEVYNANLGNAFEVDFSAQLPQGLTYVPGTAQIAYPTGGAFLPWSNPQTLPNNLIYWDVSAALPSISNGLPPIPQSPQHSFTIRFRAQTECGFVANTQPLFTTSARKACGPIANIVRKTGVAVQLQGVNPPIQTQANLTLLPSGPITCGSNARFKAVIVLGSAPRATDSISVVIPNGFSYVPFTYIPITNAVTNPPNTMNGWQIPILPTLVAGDVISFEFDLRLDTLANCQDQSVSLLIRQTASAFCPAINAPCAVYISTGEARVNIPVTPNQVELSNIGVAPHPTNPNIVGISMVITNPTAIKTNFFGIVFTIDTNGNGQIDPGEPVARQGVIMTLDPMTSDTSWFALDSIYGYSDICRLLISINGTCFCESTIESIDQVEVQSVPIISCEVQATSLGLSNPTAGSTYTWTPATNLSCTNCAMTTFTPGPTVSPGDAFTFVLTEEANTGCKVIYNHEVLFVDKPGLTASDFTICRGEFVTLNVTPAQQVSNIIWTGPGVNNPSLAQQVVSPNQTATYSVTATVAQTCTGTESVVIHVLEKDSIVISPATICAGQGFFFLGDTLKASGYYCETRTNTFGCDSIVCVQLTVLPAGGNSTALLCAGDSIQVFDTFVSAPGQYCKMFTNQLGCDSTHCIQVNLTNAPSINQPDTLYVEEGDSIQLVGPNGYAAYQWTPAQTLSCSNCQSPFATPTDSLMAYVLTVTDGNGCTGTVTYRVVLLPPCDAQRLEIPNAFSPNGDQKNDVFRVPDQEGLEVIASLKIFNRWGQLIFESNEANAAWDGKVEGKDAPMDMYIYHILIGCPAEGGGERVGEISVLR